MDYTSLNAKLVTMLKRKFPRKVKSVMGLRYYVDTRIDIGYARTISLDINKSEPPYVSYRRQDEHKNRHATVRYPKQFERILDTL
jgi:hypothetical protein